MLLVVAAVAIAMSGIDDVAAQPSHKTPSGHTSVAKVATSRHVVTARSAAHETMLDEDLPRSLQRRTFAQGSVLSPDDANLYQHIFDLQDVGNWKAADADIAKLHDRLLMGYVLAQRYLHPRYVSHYSELAEWLNTYNDHPDAPRIYALALKKRPNGSPAPTPSSFITPTPRTSAGTATVERKPLSSAERARANQLRQHILSLARRDAYVQALRLLESKDADRLFSSGESDRLRADIASRLFLSGKNDELAFDTAREAAAGDEAVMANWTAGLAAWRMGAYSEAARRFEALASAPSISSWNAAAGAFWAARSNLLAGNPENYNPWMRKAASYPRTFYGILAMRAIGVNPSFLWTPPNLARQQFDLLAADKAGRRALALLTVGEIDGAEKELLALTLDADDDVIAAVLALAEDARLPNVSLRVANSVRDETAKDRIPGLDVALYPVPPWEPKGGFVVDRALLYAFIRQESGFNPHARSWAGATGLMQLMPATARAMARRYAAPTDANKLYRPDVNMMLGQLYLRYLMESGSIGPNLFLVAAAYNSGPGNLQRWQSEVNYNDDPLLFIASIPVRETRLFIERVIANYWIYEMRLGQRTPTLDALASHRWPVYMSVDREESADSAQTDTGNSDGDR